MADVVTAPEPAEASDAVFGDANAMRFESVRKMLNYLRCPKGSYKAKRMLVENRLRAMIREPQRLECSFDIDILLRSRSRRQKRLVSQWKRRAEFVRGYPSDKPFTEQVKRSKREPDIFLEVIGKDRS